MNGSWRQHPPKQQLCGHLPPIANTIHFRWTRRAGHCWRSRDRLISDVLLWTPSHRRAKAGKPARTYIGQLCEDTGCSPEDLLEAMNDWEEWRERVRDIGACGTTRWWWWNWHTSFAPSRKKFSLNSHKRYWMLTWRIKFSRQFGNCFSFLFFLKGAVCKSRSIVYLLH